MSLSEEEDKPRQLRAKRKGVIKIFMPRLIDTTPGAFEKFQEEQRKKKEKEMREEKIKDQKIKKYFYDIEALQTYRDQEFDDFVREESEKRKVKNKGKVGFRLDNFVSEYKRNAQKDKLMKPKINFLTPLHFSNSDMNYTIEEANISKEIERSKSEKIVKKPERVVLVSNEELSKRYRSIEKAERSLKRILKIVNEKKLK